MEYYTLWQMAKHLHREVILLEDFFKSLLKKFFTLCCWHKSTVFKIWKIFVIQFYFDPSTQRAAKITNSIRKRLKVEVSTNFKCQIWGVIFQVYLNTLKYHTYSHWSHLQLWVSRPFTNRISITPRWACRKRTISEQFWKVWFMQPE